MTGGSFGQGGYKISFSTSTNSPVPPENFCLLGKKIDEQFFVDKVLPMGASCAPALLETFSTFLEWVVRKQSGSERICHYADDFLFVGEKGAASGFSCLDILNCFRVVCGNLGVPLAEEKTVEPTTQLTFLGLDINTESQTISVPDEKLRKISEMILSADRAKNLTMRSLQSLIGSLSFICRAVAPGRAFFRRLIDLLKGVKKPWHKIQLRRGQRRT